MLLLVAYAHAAGLADCARPYDTAEILDAATAAEEAFKKVDAAAFAEGRAAVESRMVCSKDILNPAAIARIHRVEVLGSFLKKETTRVPQALAGVFAAEPGHQIPAALLPDGHPIRAQVAVGMMALRDDPGADLPAVASGWIEIDGVGGPKAPTQRAALLQQIDGQGAVIATHYRWPDEAGFDWVVPVKAAIQVAGTKAPTKTASPWAHRAPLLVLTGASLATSGVMYALAAEGRAEFDGSPVLGATASADERSTYEAELAAMQVNTNGMTYGFYALAGVGVALGAVTVITW